MAGHSLKTADVEQRRHEILRELESEGGDWAARFEPGSLGCHELLDRTALLMALVEGQILEHPACVQNPQWFARADQAVTALNELYQCVGREHLGDGGGE